ncbi:MAG: CoA transferase [Chloroflexi bacterium]|nr:CoA transferase [Chloroflexota bacterium]
MTHDNDDTASALSPYRVLDLTEGGMNWCGKVLADMGADVIKVEPPGGSPTRNRGPFYKDEPHPERSLFWYAYCLNKRGITLDLESEEGQQLFKRLAATADFVLESFAPGYMDGLGLGYESLSHDNPGLIMASMTPFGQTGPYAHYKATDMIAWAMGGMQYASGDEDRPPVRIRVPQAELHAGAQAAAGAMVALWHRQMNGGEGQHIDVSMQVAVIWTLMNISTLPQLHKTNMERAGAYRRIPRVDAASLKIRAVHPCKDGFVTTMLTGGPRASTSIAPVVSWMEEEGAAPDFMTGRDWTTWEMDKLIESGEEGIRDIQGVHDAIDSFFLTKTKAELYERALTKRFLLAPCNTPKDMVEDPQLKARDFWVDVHHPELGASLTYLGPYIKLGESPIKISRRAPLIGEHNEEILEELDQHEQAREASQKVFSSSRVKAVNPKKMPFEGVKILDFTWIGVGPITVKYLADHGADVIHVESVTRPDILRAAPPFKDGQPGINRSQFPASFNTSKYGLGLNMAKPSAVELIKRIIAEWQPDIIAESFTPKAMRNWGLDYESVKKIKPDIIYFSTCQQGQTGPRAMYPGYGQFASSLAGFYQITGWPDREPVTPYGAYSDFVNPPNGFTAIVAALEYRRRTGKGQHLDLSQYEGATHYKAPVIMDYLVNGRITARNGNRDEAYSPHGVYPCKEEVRALTGVGESWCAIAVTTDEEWKALCHAMGSPAWTQEARFATFASRKENEDEMESLLGEWTAQYQAHEVMRLLQKAGVPAGAVQSQADLWEDPQLQHRDHFQWLDHTECGPMPYDGLQFTLSKTPGKLRPQALIGEHNELILKEFISLSDNEIGNLVADEVLETSF